MTILQLPKEVLENLVVPDDCTSDVPEVQSHNRTILLVKVFKSYQHVRVAVIRETKKLIGHMKIQLFFR